MVKCVQVKTFSINPYINYRYPHFNLNWIHVYSVELAEISIVNAKWQAIYFCLLLISLVQEKVNQPAIKRSAQLIFTYIFYKYTCIFLFLMYI